MNKKLIIVFLFLLIVKASAQTSVYHPIPDSNAVWNIWLSDADCNMINTYWERFSYVFGGDTILNTIRYHKIYKPFIQITGCSGSMGAFSPYNHSGLAGCIRQDTLNKMVYIIPNDSTSEQILYDFNLQVNDTLKGYANYECSWIKTITSIDSILIGNSYRKKFNFFNSSAFGAFIIEGIGSSVGLLDFCAFTLSPCNHLGCFAENGLTRYTDGVFSTCDAITSINKNSLNNIPGNFFPNPFHSTARLELTNFFINAELKIFNAFGELIQLQKIVTPTTIINRQRLEDGIYFYQVINDKGILTSGKLIIE